MKTNFSFLKFAHWFDPAQINLVKEAWDRLHKLPGGKLLFSRTMGFYAPYTGTIPAIIEELERGYARVSLRESRSIRNHLRSIHAIALANLAELTGNIALIYALPPDARFIVSKIEIEYLKKARGKIQGVCECPIPTSSERHTYKVPVQIFNAAGELVCRSTLYSLVGPKIKGAS